MIEKLKTESKREDKKVVNKVLRLWAKYLEKENKRLERVSKSIEKLNKLEK